MMDVRFKSIFTLATVAELVDLMTYIAKPLILLSQTDYCDDRHNSKHFILKIPRRSS